jgi:glycosyltransferase involved in cell wall biosynthesis
LRILQVVTLISDDAAYGGPVRVAMNQTAALRARGHHVTVAGGWRGSSQRPVRRSAEDSVLYPVRTLVPGTGFAGLMAPGLVGWVRGLLPEVDVVHIHLARDFVTLPVARAVLRDGAPLVAQPHGMIDPSGHPLSRPLDRLLTRPVLRGATRVLHLTSRERTDLMLVAGDGLRLEAVPNGVPEPAELPRLAAQGPPEVLFLARLHPRKRPEVFVEMARRLHSAGVEAQFTMVGPLEGDPTRPGDRVSAGVIWEGALAPAATSARLARAAVYVLPSVDEPYPMSVLEALAVGVPVVITESNGLAPLVRRTGCGIVVDTSVNSLVHAVRSLLNDPISRRQMGARGAHVVRAEFGMGAIAARLENVYAEISSASRADRGR